MTNTFWYRVPTDCVFATLLPPIQRALGLEKLFRKLSSSEETICTIVRDSNQNLSIILQGIVHTQTRLTEKLDRVIETQNSLSTDINKLIETQNSLSTDLDKLLYAPRLNSSVTGFEETREGSKSTA